MLRVQTYKGFIIKKTAFIKRNGAYIKLNLLLPFSYSVLRGFIKKLYFKKYSLYKQSVQKLKADK